jgi:hypothetical protein
MSTKNLKLLVFLISISAILSCKKENLNQKQVVIKEVNQRDSAESNEIVEYIISLGFAGDEIIELEDFYLVEGDILFPKNHDYYKDNLGGGTKQASTNNLVSQENINTMTVFVDPSIPTTGIDNWRPGITLALYDMNSVGCSRVLFIPTTSSAADITITSDNGILGDSTIAAAGFPSSNQPFNFIFINLDFFDNMTVSQAQQRYNIVHELGHCIGLRHTNWITNDGPPNPVGANLISGTSNNDPNSVMNGGTALYEWNGFSTDDIIAIETLYPKDWMYSNGGTGSWQALSFAGGIDIALLRFGDFNADGKTDVFHKSGSQWRYSSGGVGSWVNLSSSSIPLQDLRFGDFNGDGKTDVFNKSGNQWRYSSGGVGSWVNLSSSSIPLEDLRFGDFNGDGKTDVFNKSGNQWRYSSGGAGSWVNLSSASIPLEDLRFGDFNADGKTDVFNKSGNQWRYSSGGAGSWVNLASASIPLEDLRFGDFNADGKTDVFQKSGSQWRYSSGGVGSWVNLSSSEIPLENLIFGDFDGDGFTDVFTVCGT